ncbi:MAG: hypothetical protein LBK71_07580, partial [Verrucomicrobiales bacterium]|nr:hypothetical protein [Verrucomicrobiales bacterium]
VLQRHQPIPVWGSADADATVSVTLGGQPVTTVADRDGHWRVNLPASPAVHTPLTLTVTSGTATRTVSDVLVGEVWLCSGQSNMAWQAGNSVNGKAEVAAAEFPNLRLLTVPIRTSPKPERDLPAKWQVCTPETARTFTAVGFFFGRELYQKLGVPVGLINASVGGTPAESWTRLGALQNGEPEFAELLHTRALSLDDSPEKLAATKAQLAADRAVWAKKITALLAAPGAPDPRWFDPAYIPAPREWYNCAVPGSIESAAGARLDGSFWLRKVFDAPATAATDGDATLRLGAIDDYDFTWLNGQLIGSTGEANPDAYKTPRAYPIPAGLLRPGKNVIVSRVVDRHGDCLIRGEDADQFIATVSGSIPLAGAWQTKIEHNLGLEPAETYFSGVAGTLYDGMIAPLVPYGLRGVIWYQGESNSDRAGQYQKLFPRLITNWREDWGQGDFPFYFVQLANFSPCQDFPTESRWAELREAQLMTLSLPNTGMAVIIDAGDARDIHPRDKQTVGHRLALIALSRDYGFTEKKFLWFKQPLEYSGPIFRQMTVSGGKIILEFDHLGKGLVNKNPAGGLQGFAVSADGQTFVWADATIRGDRVIVSADGVPHPVAVRYAWADNPAASLYNADGLPASPFQAREP